MKTFKRFLSGLLSVIMIAACFQLSVFIPVAAAETSHTVTGESWKLVTAPTDGGEYLLVISSSGSSSTTKTYKLSDTTNGTLWTVSKSGNGYSIKSPDGKYLNLDITQKKGTFSTTYSAKIALSNSSSEFNIKFNSSGNVSIRGYEQFGSSKSKSTYYSAVSIPSSGSSISAGDPTTSTSNLSYRRRRKLCCGR